jgi:hypothetical protein
MWRSTWFVVAVLACTSLVWGVLQGRPLEVKLGTTATEVENIFGEEIGAFAHTVPDSGREFRMRYWRNGWGTSEVAFENGRVAFTCWHPDAIDWQKLRRWLGL